MWAWLSIIGSTWNVQSRMRKSDWRSEHEHEHEREPRSERKKEHDRDNQRERGRQLLASVCSTGTFRVGINPLWYWIYSVGKGRPAAESIATTFIMRV